jgi:hypothetical protein
LEHALVTERLPEVFHVDCEPSDCPSSPRVSAQFAFAAAARLRIFRNARTGVPG